MASHTFVLVQAHSQHAPYIYRTYQQALLRLSHFIALSCCLHPSATLTFPFIPGAPQKSREQNTMARTRMLASACPVAVKEYHPCKVCVGSPGSRAVSAQPGERREVVIPVTPLLWACVRNCLSSSLRSVLNSQGRQNNPFLEFLDTSLFKQELKLPPGVVTKI